MKIPDLKSKDLLSVTDLDYNEIINIFKFAEKLKRDRKKGKRVDYLRRKSLGMIFEKSSTRTRVSFETGITQMGGHALFLSSDDIQLGRGETISDTARVLSRYVDGIMIRTFSHDKVLELAKYASVPVINGLTDEYHPCQALTDIFTIYEREKNLKDVKLAYVGDGNNVLHSLLLIGAILGVNVSVASPKKYMPDASIVLKAERIAAQTGSRIEITDDIETAVTGAHYLYTDVWTSMGQEKETKVRMKHLSKYKITRDMLSICDAGCLVMHCLPAHRGEEIDADVLDSDKAIIFDQAENRLHVQKAVMCALMKRRI